MSAKPIKIAPMPTNSPGLTTAPVFGTGAVTPVLGVLLVVLGGVVACLAVVATLKLNTAEPRCPVMTTWWEPAAILAGKVTRTVTVPVCDAVKVPRVIGVECSSAITSSPGTKPDA